MIKEQKYMEKYRSPSYSLLFWKEGVNLVEIFLAHDEKTRQTNVRIKKYCAFYRPGYHCEAKHPIRAKFRKDHASYHEYFYKAKHAIRANLGELYQARSQFRTRVGTRVTKFEYAQQSENRFLIHISRDGRISCLRSSRGPIRGCCGPAIRFTGRKVDHFGSRDRTCVCMMCVCNMPVQRVRSRLFEARNPISSHWMSLRANARLMRHHICI